MIKKNLEKSTRQFRVAPTLSILFKSLGLGTDFANQIEQVRRFKPPNDAEKVAPIQVTLKMDGNGGPALLATEITKAAKCLKDNPIYKPVYISPDRITANPS